MAKTKRPQFRVNDRVTLAAHTPLIPAYAGKPFVGRDTVLRVSSVVGKGTLREPWGVNITDDAGNFWHMQPGDIVRAERGVSYARKKKSPAQLDREIADALARPRRGVAGYSNYGGGGPFAPMSAPLASPTPSTRKRRAAHATKKTGERDKTSDKITIDQLAKMFGLPDWDSVDERNQHHYWEMARGADDEEAQQEAEMEAQTEVYNQWYDAVEATADKLFGEHGLELKATGKQGTPSRRYEFKITPANSWNDAADKIRETINGVGDFHFNDLKEFLHVESATPRQAVLSPLGYIKRYPAVYGGLGANQMYEQHWR